MPSARHRRIDLQIATARRGIPHARTLRTWATLGLPRSGAICIRIVGAGESRKLNRQWRNKDKPTNVLSFPYSGRNSLGDVVICAPQVALEAREQKKPLAAHWAHLVIHGVLHLRGFDHQTRRDAARMEALEIHLLAKLGFPNPYVAVD